MTPMNRKEVFLKAVADGSASPLEPMTREGLWLDAIIEAIAEGGSGGGSSGGGVLVASMNLETMTLNKTWQEIHDAVLNGGAVLQIEAMGIAAPLSAANNNGTYIVSTVTDKILKLSTDSANGYPVIQQ